LPDSFLWKYNMTHTHSTCRTCRWAAAKKYGLGWNPREQNLEELHIPRKVCHDSNGVLTHPFRETWLLSGQRSVLMEQAEDDTQQICEVKQTNFSRSMRFGNHVLTRTVRTQDGVTDIYVEDSKLSQETSAGLVLRMGTDIDGQINTTALTSQSLRNYRFQDKEKRMTILTSRNIAIKIRVIVENIEQYSDSLNRTNYYGQVLTEDFLNPLEKFVVWGNPKNESDWVGLEMDNLGLISTMDDDDDPEVLEQEQKELDDRMIEEARAMRKSLIKVNDLTKLMADKQALSGVKKLIAEGIINVNHTDDDENEGALIQKEEERLKEKADFIRQILAQGGVQMSRRERSEAMKQALEQAKTKPEFETFIRNVKESIAVELSRVN
jgi:hypothetical protein